MTPIRKSFPWLVLLAGSLAGVAPAETLPPVADGKVPATLEELWAGFDPRREPLDAEVLDEWEQEEIVCRIVRYRVGVFKGAPAVVAAFFAFPKGGTKLPALVEMHGGGQSASLTSVVRWAKRGYAALSINWGGNRMMVGQTAWSGPQTDWGRLDATHPPQRNKANHFAGPLTPDDFTLDAVESPRNSNWFLVLLAARRAITLLERQPEVDASRIGANGHSMGGKLTLNLAAIDGRIKAAVPSCGGSGDLLESEAVVPGGSRARRTALEMACVSDNAYLPLVTCPMLWLSPTNDFHAHIDNMAWNWRDLPDDRVRFSISPHLNHHHVDAFSLAEHLWFDQHLKGAAFSMPRTPRIDLELHSSDGVPRVAVVPDESLPVRRVEVYYSVDPHALTRFWRDGGAAKRGDRWEAVCPVMDPDQPLFAFANVVYEAPAEYAAESRSADQGLAGSFVISSRMVSAGPARLQAAGVKGTDRPDRLIDDGGRGWHDWYLLNWAHPPLWTATTRKLKDPKWRGTDGDTLHFDVKCGSDNQLVLTFQSNGWGALVPGKPAIDYAVAKPLHGSPEWQPVSVTLAELVSTDPAVTAPLATWQTVTEFTISPSGTVVKDGAKLKLDGKPWQGPRAIRNLRWEGGGHPRSTAAGTAIETGREPPSRRGSGDHPPMIEDARVETYRRVGDTDLNVWLFAPPRPSGHPLPAIVFFFGGGWTSGTPTQFVPQSRHLASRGMTAIVADYRVKSRHQVKPADCVADAKACLRWLRSNATRLGIDPARIAAGGGSAGGHLAASVATLPGLDAADDDKSVSCVPDALVLFNPGVVMADYPGLAREGFGAGRGRPDFGCEPAEISPLHHVKPGLPPMLILHGKADAVVPYATVEKFAQVMKAAGNRCDLVGYEGQPHGFFNRARYEETLAAMDEFLVSLGWLPARPEGTR